MLRIRSGIVVSQRYISTANEHARARSLFAFRLSPSLQAGLEFNHGGNHVGFMANWFAQRETVKGPALILGTSADRLGTRAHGIPFLPGNGDGGGHGGGELEPHSRGAARMTSSNPRAYFFKISKQVARLPIAPYVSVNYSETDRGINFPYGVTIQIAPGLMVLPSHDGTRGHTQLTYMRGRQTVSVLAAWNRRLGISLGYGF